MAKSIPLEDTPSTITSFLGQTGACPTIGKWTISHPIQQSKAELVSIIIKIAEASVIEKEGLLSPIMYKKLENKFLSDLANNHYQTWNPGWLEACSGKDQHTLFLLSLLRVKHPEATFKDAEDLFRKNSFQVKSALIQVIPPFLDILEEEFPPILIERKDEMMRQLEEGLMNSLQSPMLNEHSS